MTDGQRRLTLLFGAIVVVDLATKWLAASVFDGRTSGLITPDRNPNLALGILSGSSPTWALGLVFVGLVGVTVGMVVLVRQERLAPWALVAFIGGGAANWIDRIATGAVHDFLNLGVVVANVADFALLIGLIAFVVAAWRWDGTS